jgi:hypothetical protein
VARKQYTNEFSQDLSHRYTAQYGYMAATLRLAWDGGEIHLGPGEMIALHGVLERALPDVLNNVAPRHDVYFYQVLEGKVLAHPHQQQQTYMIDGTRYALLYKGSIYNRGEENPWELDIIRPDQPVQVVIGSDSKECFLKAEEQNVPIGKLLELDVWHD